MGRIADKRRYLSSESLKINQNHSFGDRDSVPCGVDMLTLALEALVMEADGWVAGLVAAFPHETVAIYEWLKQAKLRKRANYL